MPRAVLSRRELEEVLGAECSNLLKDCIDLPEKVSLPDKDKVNGVCLRMQKLLGTTQPGARPQR